MAAYTPKDPGEDIYYGHDFANLLAAGETISSASATMRVITGTDLTPSAMLSGTPVVSGTTVKHKVIDGVAGNTYMFAVTVVTSAGQTFIEAAPIRVMERD